MAAVIDGAEGCRAIERPRQGLPDSQRTGNLTGNLRESGASWRGPRHFVQQFQGLGCDSLDLRNRELATPKQGKPLRSNQKHQLRQWLADHVDSLPRSERGARTRRDMPIALRRAISKGPQIPLPALALHRMEDKEL
jgi:hypothetical protein